MTEFLSLLRTGNSNFLTFKCIGTEKKDQPQF